MNELWAVGLPILIVDLANPVLLAAVILALSTGRPYAMSIALIAGHMAGYFIAGVLILFGLAEMLARLFKPFMEWLNNPAPVDFVAGLLLGLLLVAVAWRWKVAPPSPPDSKPGQKTGGVFSAFALGAVINFVGIPFALPYFAFINALYRLDEDHKLVNLLVYNALYTLFFLLIPLALAIFGTSVIRLFRRINERVEKYPAFVMPVVIGLLGMTLITDAMKFFLTGKGLL